MPPRIRFGLVLAAACFLSGTAALVDQVFWARVLALSFGQSVGAVATVLSVFMGGLGLGSALAARALRSRPVGRWDYPALEVGIALSALSVAPLVAVIGSRLGPLHDQGATTVLVLARLAIAALVLLPPATLMGATLPVLAALSRGGRGHEGAVTGRLYSLNTLGAVFGSLMAPLALLPGLGISGGLLAAAAMNVLAAILVAAWGWSPPAVADAAPPAPAAVRTSRSAAIALGVAAASGFGGLAHEVGWTRALVLIVGPTPHAFAFIVAAVVAGIGLGSAAAARLADRARRPVRLLAFVQLALALASLAVTNTIGPSPVFAGELVRAHGHAPARLLTLELLAVFGLLLVPCVLLGATFPLAVAVLARAGESAGRAMGRTLAWNTAGAVCGSLAAGFAALPALGPEGTLRAAAEVHALAAAAAALGGGAVALAVPALLAAASAAWIGPAWDRELITGGAYWRGSRAASDVEEDLRAGEIVFDRDGRSATVTVRRLGGTLGLAIDGKVDASTGGDMLTQRMLAHLPLALHEAPRSVCVIGLGSGVTVGSALLHPVESLDVVELSPEVVEASRLFRPWNRDPLADGRVRLLVADGRNHLRLTSRRYDVIVSEPSNPWMAGVASLFTTDAFRDARSRLAPGGLFAQWVQLYGLDTRDLKTIVAGFTDVYPRAALFVLSEGDALLIGHGDRRSGPDVAEVVRRLARDGARQDLADAGVTSPAVFASLFAMDGDALRAWAAVPDRHTDDRPLLELRAPRVMLAASGQDNLASILDASRRAGRPEPWRTLVGQGTPADVAARAAMLERGGSPVWAFMIARDALRRDPASASARDLVVRLALQVGGAKDAERELRGMLPGADEVGLRTALAALLADSGRVAEAGTELMSALDRDSRHVPALLRVAALQLRLGRPDAALLFASRAAVLAPHDAEAGALVAGALLAQGRADEAAERVRDVLALDPAHAGVLAVAAHLRLRAQDLDGARGLVERLVATDPDDPEAHGFLAGIERERGRPEEAALAFERAVELDQDDAVAWQGLRDMAEALGDPRRIRRAERALARLEAARTP